MLPFNRRYTHVSTINTHHRTIHPVNPYRPHLRFNRLTDKMLFAAVVLVLFLLDDVMFPLILKLWLFLLFSVSYLFLHDSNSPIQVRYYHPSRGPKKRKAKQHGIPSSSSTIKYSHGVALSTTTTTSVSSDSAQHGLLFWSVRHCDFIICKVKLTTDEGRWWMMDGWMDR